MRSLGNPDPLDPSTQVPEHEEWWAPPPLLPWEGSEELEVSHEASCSGSFPCVYKPQTPSLAASKPWRVGNAVAQRQEGKGPEDRASCGGPAALLQSWRGLTALAGARSPGWGSAALLSASIMFCPHWSLFFQPRRTVIYFQAVVLRLHSPSFSRLCLAE